MRFLPWSLQFGLERITGLPAPCSVHSPSDRIAGQLEVSSPRGVLSAHAERSTTVAGLLPKHLRQKSLYGAQEQCGERREVFPYILSLWCLVPRFIFPETSCPRGIRELPVNQSVSARQTNLTHGHLRLLLCVNGPSQRMGQLWAA